MRCGQDRRDGPREVDAGRGRRGLADPDRVAVGLDLVVGPPGLDALGVILGVPAGLGARAFLVDEEPLLALVVLEGAGARVVALALAAAGPDDREAAVDLLAVEFELQLPGGDVTHGVQRRGFWLPRAPVPHDHIARTVLLGRDDALEIEILDGVVLDVDRHASDRGIERRPLGHGPAHQHALDLEAEVVVQPRGPVALDDEAPGTPRRRGGRGLGRLREVALAPVFLEWHQAVSVP